MRKLTTLTWITSIIGIYHLVIIGQLPTWLGIFLPNQIHLAVSVTCALFLIFSLRRASDKLDSAHGTEKVEGRAQIPWYDYLLMASTAVGTGFVMFFFDDIDDYGMYGELDTKGMIVALCLVIPLFEGIRRTTGWALPIILLTFVMGTLFQQFLPGLLYGKGYPLDRLLFSSYVGESGIFGLPLNVAANIVIVFLIFGALMQVAGAGRWFIDIALALTGWSRGGPAKAAVLSSAMFGSISGSPSGNAATTGVFTIPMMKEIGYKPAFAGAVEAVRKAADGATADFGLDEISYRLPVPRPAKIFCVGRNYRGYHEVKEDGRPDWPSIFPRFTNSFSPNDEAIIRPSNDGDELDYEGELVVVIGKRTRRIAEKDALSAVGGYSIANEGSVRNWIGRGTQNCPVKNHWRSGSIGPWIVTADEVPDPSKLHIKTRVNGEVRQDGGTDMMIFDIPFVIAHISRFTELEPGDMICTGSPGGSAIEFDPPSYLKPGDKLEVEIAPIGTLTNPIEAE